MEPSLPPERAFVVQFCGGTTVQAADSGRVEHVVSGRASHFESIEQLLSFVERMLRSVAPTNDPQR